ncbi:hypothetical protein SAMN05660337_3081 [Maridesulfovibrio ferrireducens]|uniref:Uncharacterized protein n=1 Tax=Maridesulfovibrio ferrireducens TaxID=246191 RepID=A0A1G9KGS6_9BACT|nr:hypothetical protein [Maridesulfovibrio ferrireducens]SDL49038.1 hypothetical protein SAMN05660337_3081 [Maridesulfovibrio ferrireducens]
MKRFAVLSVILIVMSSIYNTNVFQAYFMSDQYYKSIFEGSFDASIKGERLLIPISFKYKTEYDLLISIPKNDKKCFFSEKGALNYKFTSRGKILEEGITKSPSNTAHYCASSEGPLSALLLRFNLPFPEAGDDLVLVLEAVNPLKSFSKYSGSIICTVEPALMN